MNYTYNVYNTLRLVDDSCSLPSSFCSQECATSYDKDLMVHMELHHLPAVSKKERLFLVDPMTIRTLKTGKGNKGSDKGDVAA